MKKENKPIRFYLEMFWLFVNIWDIRTLFRKYDTPEKWDNAGQPLELKTAWEVARGIWLEN